MDRRRFLHRALAAGAGLALGARVSPETLARGFSMLAPTPDASVASEGLLAARMVQSVDFGVPFWASSPLVTWEWNGADWRLLPA